MVSLLKRAISRRCLPFYFYSSFIIAICKGAALILYNASLEYGRFKIGTVNVSTLCSPAFDGIVFMLSPASLGICCLAVMAPALTKAVNQAEDFNLPLFYRHSGISIQQFTSVNFEQCDVTFFSFTTFKDLKKTYVFIFSSQSWGSDLLHYSKQQNYHEWLVEVHQLAIYASHLPYSNSFVEALCGTNTLWCNVYLQRCVGVKCPTTQICFCWSTMSKDIPVSQDRMGLLNANTSLDCEFKPKIDLDRQAAWPSDFVSTTKDLGSIESMAPQNFCCEVTKYEVPASGDNVSEVMQVSAVCYTEMQEARKKHVTCEHRVGKLLSKIRNLQAKHSEVHVIGQLKAFVEHQQKSLSVQCQRQQRPNSFRKTKDSEELKAELLQSEDVRNLSTAALVNLVKRLESSHASGKLLHSQKSVSSCTDSQTNDKVVVKLNLSECTEIHRASGTLQNSLHHLEYMIDSDVTESSSGGESCDEFDGYEEKNVQQPPPIHKRALWKWAVDRAAVASRWTWLQAQVSDLEYRIRQQNEIYKQLRATKGNVSLELPQTTETSSNSISVESLGCQNTAFNQVTAKCPPKTVNGFLDRGSVATSNGYHTVRNVPPTPEECLDLQLKQQLLNSDDSSCQASRTLPLKSSFRKRRLLQTTGLHLISRRASRLSTVRCSCNCQSDMMPCALCGGRYNNIQSVDPDMMPLLERIALLDPSFHPVLSFEQDVPLPLHFETLLKKSEQYHFASRAGSTIQKKPRLAMKSKDFSDSVRKHSRKLTRTAAQVLLSSAKYRKKHGRKPGQRHYRKRGSFVGRWRRLSRDRNMEFTSRERHRRCSGGSSGSSKPSSPVPPGSLDDGSNGTSLSSLQGRPGSFQEFIRRRRGDNAYDINNIIIPYSIASATRVEKLQYKEIITPKWRIVEDISNLSGDENGNIKSDEEMEEDISDEMILKRHQKCEEDEKKHYGSHLHLQNARGRCRGSRFDSRADSSGANTPDPLSPYQQDIMFQDSNSMIIGGPSSPALSPPATPLSAVLSDDSQPSGSSVPAQRSERKRTVSLSKRDRPTEETVHMPEKERVYAPPYEPRIFPLLDEEYEEMLKNSPHLQILGLSSSKDLSTPGSPESTSTASSVPEDDTADPEWTVIRKEKDGGDQALILKLAKR